MIRLKTPADIAILAEGGAILADILRRVASLAAVGVSTAELDRVATELIAQAGGVPAFKGYRPTPSDEPYPTTLCASINEEVVHGIPSPARLLQAGDVLSIDIGMRYRNRFTDTATTVIIGAGSPAAQKLLAVTNESLRRGIAQVKPGNTIMQIAQAIQGYVEGNGLAVVKDLVGHGVGFDIHEDPRVPNFVAINEPAVILRPGLVIAIEPMVTAGTDRVDTLDDGWTVVSADGSLAAHFEHTVAVTADGVQILTA